VAEQENPQQDALMEQEEEPQQHQLSHYTSLHRSVAGEKAPLTLTAEQRRDGERFAASCSPSSESSSMSSETCSHNRSYSPTSPSNSPSSPNCSRCKHLYFGINLSSRSVKKKKKKKAAPIHLPALQTRPRAR
jgi:hypothetical protein